MRLVTGLLLLAASGLGGFAWWGLATAAGRARYDEMDGLYPLGAAVLAGAILLAALALRVILWWRDR